MNYYDDRRKMIEDRIMIVISKNDRLNVTQICEAAGVTRSYINNHISRLVSDNKIEPEPDILNMRCKYYRKVKNGERR